MRMAITMAFALMFTIAASAQPVKCNKPLGPNEICIASDVTSTGRVQNNSRPLTTCDMPGVKCEILLGPVGANSMPVIASTPAIPPIPEQCLFASDVRNSVYIWRPCKGIEP